MKSISHLKSILLLFCFSVFFSCKSQKIPSYWKSSEESKGNIVLHKNSQRENFPKDFRLYQLHLQTFKTVIFEAVTSKKSVLIVLPNVDGNYETFEVFETSNFSPELQAKFPELRSFSGKGITDTFATAHISYSPEGIAVMISRANKESEFTEVYSDDRTIYAVFNKSDKSPNWNCTTPTKER